MTKKIKTISHTQNLRGKRVLLRVDVNVPLEETKRGIWRMADDTRIRESLPAIERLIRAGAKIIVVAHLGEPRGKVLPDLRLQPVAESLRRHLNASNHVFHTATTWNFNELTKQVYRLHDSEVLLLENVRFHPGEEKNDMAFAKALASLGDLYINEAFSVSHRAHASIVRICSYLPHYAGWHLADEVKILERVRTRTKTPLVLVVGGAKVHDKIDMMLSLAPKASTILLGGIAANTVLKLQRVGIGRSRTEVKPPTAALRRLLKQKRRLPGEKTLTPLLQLPVDVVVARDIKSRPKVVNFSKGEKLLTTETIFDIGPETIQLFSTFLRAARTIIWNGPLGLIEEPRFRHGSLHIARVIASRSRGQAFGVVGGGESLEVLHQTHMADNVDFCSTGGGAMLEFLAGKKLPGIEALKS